jgi:fused signal recognition particle receptor
MGIFNKLFNKKDENKKDENKNSENKEDINNIENKGNKESTEEKEKKEEANLREKLTKPRTGFFSKLKTFFTGKNLIDDAMYEEMEDILIQSDIGVEMTTKIVGSLEKEIKLRGIKDTKEIYPILKEVMGRFLIKENTELKIEEGQVNIILVVGVNGVGKTTTIGKLASKLIKNGKKVVLGAGDTFRAAAIEQLEEWAKRSGAEIIKGKHGADPGAVVYDTLEYAFEKNADVVIIDTAGRLHNKNNLMKELEKINNIIKKKIGDRYYESILVIDGTTGQNAISQAKEFNEVTDLTGFIITKLDGTAKGGIVFSISELIKKPIKFIGIGEKISDLREFDAGEYINAIFD